MDLIQSIEGLTQTETLALLTSPVFKAFLSDQCKEIQENNRMGKTRDLFKKIRDLFKKIRDSKGKFHAKMGSVKDRKGMDLTEAKDIKKMWQKYTEELCKKRSS